MTVLDPTLYLVLDAVRAPDALGLVDEAVAGGVTAVQVRSPGADGRDLYEATVAVGARLAGTPVAVTVDDRLDVALAAGVDGVHLGRRDLPPEAARQVAGPDLVLGWSVTGRADLRTAVDLAPATADLLGAGPVFPTSTKADADPPLGLEGLADLVRDTPITTVAIGGITADNAAAVAATGVHGLAVSSAVVDAADPRAAAAALRAAVARA